MKECDNSTRKIHINTRKIHKISANKPWKILTLYFPSYPHTRTLKRGELNFTAV